MKFFFFSFFLSSFLSLGLELKEEREGGGMNVMDIIL